MAERLGGIGNAFVARGRANIPVLPAMIAANGDAVAAGKGAGSADGA